MQDTTGGAFHPTAAVPHECTARLMDVRRVAWRAGPGQPGAGSGRPLPLQPPLGLDPKHGTNYFQSVS
ncbi:hypothetical protein ONE63_001122 [Megalurothrips usitatus]|uniref:Uncharacterized protein n=1 Tax=Megalurothrips usitatus TaxID=439358 RepID=A0AAV7XF57_9NEOP|nr:hypothetical protein ONE63_001122 [Megalurothrips usitatus]